MAGITSLPKNVVGWRNMWRLPDIAFKNGEAAFLITHLAAHSSLASQASSLRL